MTPPQNCPQRDELRAFALGMLDDTDSHTVLEHIKVCPSCHEAFAAEGDPVDELVASLRRPIQDDFVAERECELAVERGQSLGGRLVADMRGPAERSTVLYSSEAENGATFSLRMDNRSHARRSRLIYWLRRWLSQCTTRRLPDWAEGYISSAFVHVVVLAALAMCVIRPLHSSPHNMTISYPAQENIDGHLTLDSLVMRANDMPASEGESWLMDPGDIGDVASVSPLLVEQAEDTILDRDQPWSPEPTVSLLNEKRLSQILPSGSPGKPREIVDDYEEALLRITQELLELLVEQQVVVIWCFDQSESMKDDQKRIRDLLHGVYDELGRHALASGDALTTVVTSFGKGVRFPMREPTSDIATIHKAIESIPVDSSGIELMCQAVRETVSKYKGYARGEDRRMVLVLITDESGEPDDNQRNLEHAIKAAKAAHCIVHCFGREAVFGYPLAYMSWHHPQTRQSHMLPINRGPESAIVEQLQTDGFQARSDAFPSGFGPYDQCRLVVETGGIFFMLPGQESNLVRTENRRYELESVRRYLPELKSREDCRLDISNSPFRSSIAKIIHYLDPRDRRMTDAINMRMQFSTSRQEFSQQVAEETPKANGFIAYLSSASQAIEEFRDQRQAERSPRWQANYDLLGAQLVAYSVRLREYIVCLDNFVRHPPNVSLRKPPNLVLGTFNVYTRGKLNGGQLTEFDAQRAEAMLRAVIEKYPRTPWAARAKWELQRGLGVALRAQYTTQTAGDPQQPRMPRPKL